jgi:hypothetical protein
VVLATGATALTIVMANWSIASTYMGGVMGLPFLDSALRLGPDLAWTLLKLANGPGDLAWMAAALVLAAIAAR